MRDMHGPENAAHMPNVVKHPIEKILKYDQSHPIEKRLGLRKETKPIGKRKHQQAVSIGCQPKKKSKKSEVYVCESVALFVIVPVFAIAEPHFCKCEHHQQANKEHYCLIKSNYANHRFEGYTTKNTFKFG